MTELPEYGASAIWHSHSMSVSCLSCLAATSNYSRLAQQMLPVLDFGTGKNVLVINTGHGIQVTAAMQSAVSNCLPHSLGSACRLGICRTLHMSLKCVCMLSESSELRRCNGRLIRPRMLLSPWEVGALAAY